MTTEPADGRAGMVFATVATDTSEEVSRVMSNGESVFIKGTITADENFEIAGKVEGTIEVRNHLLTIAPNARVFATVSAKAVRVAGALTGEVNATDRVEVCSDGSLEGDVSAPRIAMQDGAVFHGKIDMPGRSADDRRGEVVPMRAPAPPLSRAV
ncbi:MAG TPA: polymer-forming cytoskeletal protein [Vicinamibacterales bacterium]|nr:polymer-forming cytoskeletal protein [Vicinamibacterales bacterium]